MYLHLIGSSFLASRPIETFHRPWGRGRGRLLAAQYQRLAERSGRRHRSTAAPSWSMELVNDCSDIISFRIAFSLSRFPICGFLSLNAKRRSLLLLKRKVLLVSRRTISLGYSVSSVGGAIWRRSLRTIRVSLVSFSLR